MYYQSDDETASLSIDDDDINTVATYSISDSDNVNDDRISVSSSETNDSIIIEFDEYSDDEQDDYIIDEIYSREHILLDSEKHDGQYYIGLAKHMKNRHILLLNTITTESFYKYSYIHVLKYLYYYSLVRLYQPNVEIMKLYILNDGTYSVVLKTHWLRLIQRHWRKALQMRKQIMKKQMHVSSLYHREIYGRFPNGINKLPLLTGLMNRYTTY
jgi:hypothetical protein